MATPKQWENIEGSAEVLPSSACILELRARVEALEEEQTELVNSHHFVIKAITERLEKLESQQAQKSETDSIIDYYSLLAAQSKGKAVFHGPTGSQEPAEFAPVAGGLVERVAAAIHPDRCADPNLYLHEARAAILEVARWLRSELGLRNVAERLEQEAGR